MIIYTDSAGTYSDEKERVIVFAALLCSNRQKRLVDSYCREIKDLIPTNLEFHAYEIFIGSGDWRGITEEKRFEIADKLKNVINIAELSFVVIYIDKDKGGKSSLEKFRNQYKGEINKELSKIPSDQLAKANAEVNEMLGNKGFGPLVSCYNLLFGMVSGLLNLDSYEYETSIVADEQFIRNMQGWNSFFKIGKYVWPFIKQSNVFQTWPEEKQPDWRFNENIRECNSKADYGIQLVDYIAYTTKHVYESEFNSKRFCVIKDNDLVPFGNYEGVFWAMKHYPLKKKKIKYTYIK